MMAIYLALGSNLGNRRANLAFALRTLDPLVRVEDVSPLYQSAPEGGADQPAYYNAVCRVVTGLPPAQLLRFLKHLEFEIGRRPYAHGHGAPRPIDLDIALYDDLVLATDELVIPHPRLIERAFVLRPLLDIAPDANDPRTGRRLGDALSALPEDGLHQLAAGDWWRAAVPA